MANAKMEALCLTRQLANVKMESSALDQTTCKRHDGGPSLRPDNTANLSRWSAQRHEATHNHPQVQQPGLPPVHACTVHRPTSHNRTCKHGWPTPGTRMYESRANRIRETSKPTTTSHHESPTRHEVYASPPVRTPNLVSNRAASSAVTAGTKPRSTKRDVVSGVAFHPRAVWKKMIDNRSCTEP